MISAAMMPGPWGLTTVNMNGGMLKPPECSFNPLRLLVQMMRYGAWFQCSIMPIVL